MPPHSVPQTHHVAPYTCPPVYMPVTGTHLLTLGRIHSLGQGHTTELRGGVDATVHRRLDERSASSVRRRVQNKVLHTTADAHMLRGNKHTEQKKLNHIS
jgi:hypothetical protein